MTTPAIGRYGFRVREVAGLIRKHGNSVTKWLNQGLRSENVGPQFRRRIDELDGAISRRG